MHLTVADGKAGLSRCSSGLLEGSGRFLSLFRNGSDRPSRYWGFPKVLPDGQKEQWVFPKVLPDGQKEQWVFPKVLPDGRKEQWGFPKVLPDGQKEQWVFPNNGSNRPSRYVAFPKTVPDGQKVQDWPASPLS